MCVCFVVVFAMMCLLQREGYGRRRQGRLAVHGWVEKGTEYKYTAHKKTKVSIPFARRTILQQYMRKVLTGIVKYDIVRNMTSKKGITANKRPIEAGEDVQPNQWQGDERQQRWLKYYMDPKEKDTWGNAYQAAIKAGYNESYATQIMSPSLGLQWVRSAKNIMRLNPEHLKFALASIVSNEFSKDSDKIQAIKLLGTEEGMFVQKQQIQHIGIEDALEGLE